MKRKFIYLGALFLIVFAATCNTYKQGEQGSDKKESSSSGEASKYPEAPALEGQSPDGKTFKLSDYKGKIVLIDFWASWCGPCRRMNPYMVALYNKYHGKQFKNASDFEIFSVSLDDNVESWKAAIAKDKLSWPAHISDLKKWNSDYAVRYNIEGIPASFLLNEEGRIIASELDPAELDARLQSMLK